MSKLTDQTPSILSDTLSEANFQLIRLSDMVVSLSGNKLGLNWAKLSLAEVMVNLPIEGKILLRIKVKNGV